MAKTNWYKAEVIDPVPLGCGFFKGQGVYTTPAGKGLFYVYPGHGPSFVFELPLETCLVSLQTVKEDGKPVRADANKQHKIWQFFEEAVAGVLKEIEHEREDS